MLSVWFMEGPAALAAARFKELSKPSASLDHSGCFEVDVACAAAKRILQKAASDLVSEAAGLPILSSKSCDGTPMRVVHQSAYTLPSGKKVRTKGKAGMEFLVPNQFLKADVPGAGWTTRVLLTEPVALEHGNMFQRTRAWLHKAGPACGSWATLAYVSNTTSLIVLATVPLSASRANGICIKDCHRCQTTRPDTRPARLTWLWPPLAHYMTHNMRSSGGCCPNAQIRT